MTPDQQVPEIFGTWTFPPQLLSLGESLNAALRSKGAKITVAESCTGGMLSAVITSVAGASDVFDMGFITYSDDAKMALLGVPSAILRSHGAVSAETAAAMASGARGRSASAIGVAITGVAGPGGGSATKPVGLVYVGLAVAGREPQTHELRLGNIGRTAIRLKSTEVALERALAAIHNLS